MSGILIGVVGFMGSGKDTVADILTEHGFVKDSFAKTLKDAASVLFGWDREMLDGTTTLSRSWREQPDLFWAKETGDPQFTPRLALQLLGTEAIRDTFAQDFWVATAVKRWKERGQPNTIITDCRFPNEINAIRKNGGRIIHVHRGPYPDWYPLVSRINKKTNTDADSVLFQTMLLNKELPHISEYAWAGQDFDILVDNNGTINDLRKQISKLSL
jgi:hypothetical protein